MFFDHAEKKFCFLTHWHEHAAYSSQSSRRHGGEQYPPPPPLVHRVPAHKVRRDLHGSADEEPQERVDVQVGRVEAEAVVDEGVGEPVEGDQHEVAPGLGVVHEEHDHGGRLLRAVRGRDWRRRRRRVGLRVQSFSPLETQFMDILSVLIHHGLEKYEEVRFQLPIGDPKSLQKKNIYQVIKFAAQIYS